MKTLFTLLLTLTTTAQAETVTFAEVFEKVISQKCLLCHSNPAKDPKDLTTYTEVMAFVTAGDPSTSKLYQMVAEIKMPPPKFLAANPELAITEDDLVLIETWIAEGAVE